MVEMAERMWVSCTTKGGISFCLQQFTLARRLCSALCLLRTCFAAAIAF